jgi:hypothetical protein
VDHPFSRAPPKGALVYVCAVSFERGKEERMDVRLSREDRQWLGLGRLADVMTRRGVSVAVSDGREVEQASSMEMPVRDLTPSSWPKPPVENAATWRGGWGSLS